MKYYLNLYLRILRLSPNRLKLKMAFVFILMLAASIAESFTIGAIYPLISVMLDPLSITNISWITYLDSYTDITDPKKISIFIGSGFAIAALLATALRMFSLYFNSMFAFEIGKYFGEGVVDRTFAKPYSDHIDENSSEVIIGISTKLEGMVLGVILPVLTLLSSIFITTTIIIMLLYVDTNMTLVTFLIFATTYLLVFFINRERISNVGRILSRESVNFMRVLQEGLGGIRYVILEGIKNLFVNKFTESYSKWLLSKVHLQLISFLPRLVIEGLILLSIAVIAIYFTAVGGATEILAKLGVIAVAAQRLLPILQQIYTSINAIKAHSPSSEDALDIFEKETFLTESNRKIHKLDGDISIKNVTFKYKKNKNVLENINLEIKKGSKIGIKGETGSGKSTLIDLIMGLHTPSSGQILVSGSLLNNTTISSWHLSIGHVPQHIYLFDDSVKSNISFPASHQNIDMEHVKKVAKICELEKTISVLKNGFDANVGEAGKKLSGGQKQRVGIARALYKKPSVLVFDEATSALDAETEKKIIDNIFSEFPNITLIMISHKLSTLAKCDKVFEVKNKTILPQ